MSIPSKWGFCEGVYIVPIQVQDAYFTAVMDAPADWHDALIVSGFNKTNEGWVKKGLANEHELGYLSENIVIEEVSDRFFESYFNPAPDEQGELPVPDEVVKAIGWLSLQGRRALSFEFSLIDPKITDADLSGYLEDAAVGVSNENTDVVYELAIERIRSQAERRELSESVAQFVKEKNITLIVQSDEVLTPTGSVIYSRGERVSWTEDGLEHFGRVSRPFKVGDDGCWLHSLPVAWVGGYPAPREMYVSSNALGLTIEPSASDTLESNYDREAAEAVLGDIDSNTIHELLGRVFKAIPDNELVSPAGTTGSYSGWVANGRLWLKGSQVTSANGADVAELHEKICPVSDEDRALIAKISNGLDVMSKSEFDGDGFERTSLVFSYAPHLNRLQAGLQYNTNALYPVDAPFIKVETHLKRSLSEGSRLLDDFRDYQVGLRKNVENMSVFAPEIEGAFGHGKILSADYVKQALNDVTGDINKFKDRVIELGIEDQFSADFVQRAVGSMGHYAAAGLYEVTPRHVNAVLAEPHKRFQEKVFRGDRGFRAWQLEIANPVLAHEAVGRLIRKDLETGLPSSFLALSGPAYAKGNDELEAAIKEAGVGRLFYHKDIAVNELDRSDVRFSADPDYFAKEIPKFQKVLEVAGCFDERSRGFSREEDVVSQENIDKWDEYVLGGMADDIRLSMLKGKLLKLDKRQLKTVVDGEVTRQWGALFAKGNYQEDFIGKIKDSIFKAVNDLALNKNEPLAVDAVLFRASRAARNFSWRYSSVNTLEDDAFQDWKTEPRSAILDYAYTKLFALKNSGAKLTIDLLSIADPQLAGKLYAIGTESSASASADKEKLVGHQDAGVVTGYALKDLRAMSIDSLLDTTAGMSNAQREKYVKKDLYFQRPNMADLQKIGCDPKVAAFLDQAWVRLPSKPYSMMSRDVDFYGQLLNAARESVESVLEDKAALEGGVAFFDAYDREMEARVKPLLNQLPRREENFYRKGSDFSAMIAFSSFGFSLGFGNEETRQDYLESVNRGFNGRFRIKKQGADWSPGAITWDALLPKKAVASATPRAKNAAPDVRTGEDYRKGKILYAEDFIKTFGFSGVEYGNWTSQAEREAHINLSYDSMLDFTKVLECEPMMLSLGGRLGLCFGSRGRGGANPASAHYEPSNMAINLTRRAGAGALAHEYFHAIAGHYGEIESGIKGSDYSTKSGNMLFNDPDSFSATPLMRKDMQEAFHNLMRAIIYKPADGGDVNNIDTYTERSELYKSSAEYEKHADKKYWSQPHEMFARSMEVWVGVELAKKGARNDYLVSNSKLKSDGELYPDADKLYPDAEHMKRISVYADKWVGSLRSELKQVQHPYLGDIEMPIFHSKNRVSQPVTHAVLEAFAMKEMNILFGKIKPSIEFNNDASPSASAGTYNLIKNLMTLNLSHADRSTFYHEAWHACHSTMLNDGERDFLSDAFSKDALKALVSDAMSKNDYTEAAIKDALTKPEELQAYAFELWAAGQLTLTEARTEGVFLDVREVVDGAASLSDAFTLKGVESMFERFYGGELALESDMRIELDAAGFDADEQYSGFEESFADDDEVGSSVIYAPALKRGGGMGM